MVQYKTTLHITTPDELRHIFHGSLFSMLRIQRRRTLTGSLRSSQCPHLNVPNRTADLDEADVGHLTLGALGLLDGNLGHALYPVLNFISNVGDNLDSFPKVVSSALAGNYLTVNLSGGNVVVLKRKRRGGGRGG